MRSEETVWGTDGVPSFPVAKKDNSARQIDMQGFCFTPDGIRIDITEIEREEFLSQGWGPVPRGEVLEDGG